MNVPGKFKGESRQFRSAQVNVKKIAKLLVKKFDNVKVDGLELSVKIHPGLNCTDLFPNYTFTVNALPVITDRLLLSRKVVKF